MKASFFVLIGSLVLLISNSSLGCCNSNTEDTSDCQQNACVESQNYCQCADVNSGSNPCISKNDYCHHFGNVGGNKLGEQPDNQ